MDNKENLTRLQHVLITVFVIYTRTLKLEDNSSRRALLRSNKLLCGICEHLIIYDDWVILDNLFVQLLLENKYYSNAYMSITPASTFDDRRMEEALKERIDIVLMFITQLNNKISKL